MNWNFLIKIWTFAKHLIGIKQTQFRNDINVFIRKIKLQTYFKSTEQNLDDGQFRVSHKQTWTPNENQHKVETFTQAFQNDLEKEEQILKQIPRTNLSKKEKNALKTLSKREDIIITKADKGGTTVFIDVDDYSILSN